MEKTKNMPLWVFLAFSAINTRKAALTLIWVCVLFSLYCVPWSLFIDNTLVEKIFRIEDWSWIAMMAFVVAWYVLSLRWLDKNSGWETPETE
ncbi:MAG: hypothetical protein AB8G18_19100 [Gammaproteobacteria bacterium]